MTKKIVCFLSLIMLLVLSSCGNSSTRGLLEFEQYENINTNTIIRIDVEWDISDNTPLEFSIDDATEIQSILTKLCDKSTFVNENNEKIDGGHSCIVLIDDVAETRISLFSISDNNKTYYYSDSIIYDKIYSIGKNLGVLS